MLARRFKKHRSVAMQQQYNLALLQARFEVDAKRTKLAKLRGTAGIKVMPPVSSLMCGFVYRHNLIH